MQTVRPNRSPIHYPINPPYQLPYYSPQSQIDPRWYLPQQMNIHPNYHYHPNYQQYNHNWSNPPHYPAYYNSAHGREPKPHSVNHMNPGYQYNQQQMTNSDIRHHSRIQYQKVPPQHHTRISPQQLPYRGAYEPFKQPYYPNAPDIQEVVYQQQPINIPESFRNIEYVPQLNRYTDYVQQRVRVPVEKYCTDYYEVEHITDFVPREYEQSVVEMVPEEVVKYKLQYVPVQRKIVHMPRGQIYDENGLFKGIGSLADRVNINKAAIGLGNISQRQSSQSSRIKYEKKTSQMPNFDQSLVDYVRKDVENYNRTQNIIHKQIYDGFKGQFNEPSRQISRAVYEGAKGNLSSPRNYEGMPGQSQQQLNQSLYQSRNPPNEYSNTQIYGASSRSQRSQSQSRKKTNFVTSDGYFPSYDNEFRNL